jgi:hypothetical protein
LQRRDIEWHDDGTATLHVRRQLNANTGDYSERLKSDAGRRTLSIPKLMIDRLKDHLRDNVAAEASATDPHQHPWQRPAVEHPMGIRVGGCSRWCR